MTLNTMPQMLKMKGRQNIYHAKSKHKKKNLQEKSITRGKEGYFIMVKGSICQEDI